MPVPSLVHCTASTNFYDPKWSGLRRAKTSHVAVDFVPDLNQLATLDRPPEDGPLNELFPQVFCRFPAARVLVF